MSEPKSPLLRARAAWLREHAEEIVEKISDLDANWYAARDIPERLIHDLAQAPIIPKEVIALRERALNYGIETRRRNVTLTLPVKQALQLASYGLTDIQIAEELGKGLGTIKTQLKEAYAILAAKNRTHACCIAIRYNLIK